MDSFGFHFEILFQNEIILYFPVRGAYTSLQPGYAADKNFLTVLTFTD